jgi:hypothetical protein
MKKIIYILFVLFTFTGFSQTKTKKIQYGKSYTTLKTYKKLYGNEFSKEDSLSFKFHGNDTLVPLPEDYKRPEGIRVEYQPKNGVFLEIYKDIVYRKYLDKAKEDSKKLTMRYWKNTLKIYFTKSVDKTIKNELKNFAKFLSTEVDSLNITFVNSLEKSNYIIYEINSKNNYKYDNRIKEGKNSYYITWDTNQRIYDCKLQINELPFEKKEDFILNTKKLFLETLAFSKFPPSALVTKIASANSIIPLFIPCNSSPAPASTRSKKKSTRCLTWVSDCPTPTVSKRITSKPAFSHSKIES